MSAFTLHAVGSSHLTQLYLLLQRSVLFSVRVVRKLAVIGDRGLARDRHLPREHDWLLTREAGYVRGGALLTQRSELTALLVLALEDGLIDIGH